MKRRLARPLAALVLGVLSTLIAAWVLPWAAVKAAGTKWNVRGWALEPGGWSDDKFWGDADADGSRGWAAPRAGHYRVRDHPLITTVNMQRVIFVGGLESQRYFRVNPPPPWATTISIDMREGYEQVVTTATGWPWRCFRGEHWISWRQPEPPPTIIKIGEVSVPLGTTPPPSEVRNGLWRFAAHAYPTAEMPHEVMWPGLLANLCAFTLAWAVLLIGPRAARRWVRTRRGQCPECGYARAGLAEGAACPECGHTP